MSIKVVKVEVGVIGRTELNAEADNPHWDLDYSEYQKQRI